MADSKNKGNEKEEKGKTEQPDATKTQMGDGGQMTEKATTGEPIKEQEKTPAQLPPAQERDEDDEDDGEE